MIASVNILNWLTFVMEMWRVYLEAGTHPKNSFELDGQRVRSVSVDSFSEVFV